MPGKRWPHGHADRRTGCAARRRAGNRAPCWRATGLSLAALILAACTPAGPEHAIIVENVTVVDAVSGVRTAQRVVIERETIQSVTPMSAPAPERGEVLDAQDGYLIPGLWDMHVHFLYDEALRDSMPELFLRWGITSVRDTGGDIERLAKLRTRLEAGPAPAPRMFLSGPLLDGRFAVYDGGDPGRPRLGTSVPDRDTAQRRVAELSAAGADFIKIYELVDPEVFEELVARARAANLPIASHVPLMMTADSAGPATDSMEHLRNIELACAANWQALLAERRARISAFTEGRGYDLRSSLHALQRLAAIDAYDENRCNQVLDSLRSTIQVPTLRLNTVRLIQPFLRADWQPALAQLPEPVQALWNNQIAAMQDSAGAAAAMSSAAPVDSEPPGGDEVRIEPRYPFEEWSLFLVGRANARGVPIGAGTDTPIGLGIPGYSLHNELELLVRGGLSPRQALEAATVTPARFFGLDTQMGQVAPGMAADLLLLDANPLDDIRHTRSIRRVMVRGRWLSGPPAPPSAQK